MATGNAPAVGQRAWAYAAAGVWTLGVWRGRGIGRRATDGLVCLADRNDCRLLERGCCPFTTAVAYTVIENRSESRHAMRSTASRADGSIR